LGIFSCTKKRAFRQHSLLLTETRFRHKIAFYERQLRNERGMTARAESAIDKL